jgi:hypothetical protein
VLVMFLVLAFQSSSNLAAAYGIAVTGTMLIDTLLVGVLVLGETLTGLQLLAFGVALLGIVLTTLMTTWKTGRATPASSRNRCATTGCSIRFWPPATSRRISPASTPTANRPRNRASMSGWRWKRLILPFLTAVTWWRWWPAMAISCRW